MKIHIYDGESSVMLDSGKIGWADIVALFKRNEMDVTTDLHHDTIHIDISSSLCHNCNGTGVVEIDGERTNCKCH